MSLLPNAPTQSTTELCFVVSTIYILSLHRKCTDSFHIQGLQKEKHTELKHQKLRVRDIGSDRESFSPEGATDDVVVVVPAAKLLEGAVPKLIPVSDGVEGVVVAAAADPRAVVMAVEAPKGGGGADVVVAAEAAAPKPNPVEAVVEAGAAEAEPAPNDNPRDGVDVAVAVDEAVASPKPPKPPLEGAVAFGGAERLKIQDRVGQPNFAKNIHTDNERLGLSEFSF